MPKKKIIAIGGLLLLSVVWGLNIPFMKAALEFSSPATFAFLRNFFGAVVLFVILILLRKPIATKASAKLFTLGLFQTAGFTGFLIWALVEGGASKTAILTFTMPMWVAIMAWPLLQEKLTTSQWIAVLICFLGIVFIFDPLNTNNNFRSTCLALASGLSWAIGAILSKRMHHQHPNMDLITMTAWQMLWGSIPLLLVAIIFSSQPTVWTAYFLGIVLFNVIFVNAIAYLLWFYALKYLEATFVSMLALLTPISAAISAWLLLGEIPNRIETIGFSLILFGLFLLLLYKGREKLT
ncbi:EamA family transporter [Methylophilaceae bacterium]|nr:EamA family transporter [Methylophilaceae bacterium]